ncbi:MAG: site-2 protease family protein [Clostridia bacterium]|nr:site-2 protease family protein [Clostridia bacterium]
MLLNAFRTGDVSYILMSILASLFVIFFVIPIHELAHAYQSYKLGDPTPKLMGRLTLNPLKHLDPLGSIMILIVGFGWGKPTPVDPRYYKDPKKDMAKVAFAGPGINLLFALILIFIQTLVIEFADVEASKIASAVAIFCVLAARINIFIAVFNLIPIPPYDGFDILNLILPEKASYFLERNQRMLNLVFLILILTGAMSIPLNFLTSGIQKLFEIIILLFLR